MNRLYQIFNRKTECRICDDRLMYDIF